MSATTIDFYYDVASPWAWIAHAILTRYKAVHPNKFDIVLKPVLLIGMTTLNLVAMSRPNLCAILRKNNKKACQRVNNSLNALGLMKAQANKPPWMGIPAKRAYLAQDIGTSLEWAGLRTGMDMPKPFPIFTILPMR